MARCPKCPRSAYSASPPVTTRKTAPRPTKPRPTSSAKKRTPYNGDTAASTPGCRTISPSPSTPMTPNQTSITGPNIAPMRAVPRLCTRNKPIRITSVTGITHEARVGAAISSPSTAESTEIAGVRPPSAYSSADPKMPSTIMRRRGARPRATRLPFTSAIKASTPPSPVVRPDDDDVVLDRDDDQQGPEHEREYAEHVAR